MSNFRQRSWRSGASEVPSSDGGGRRSLDGVKNLFSRSSSRNSSNRDYHQTIPLERPLTNSNTPSPPYSLSTVSSSGDESLQIFPWLLKGQVGAKGFFSRSDSANTSAETSPLASKYHSVENPEGELRQIKRLLPGGKISSALQNPINYANLRGRVMESYPHSTSGSSENSELQSYQSDLSYDLIDQPRSSDSSGSSTSSAAVST